MKEKGIKQWEIAEVLGVSEFTLSRWLRKETPSSKRQRILDVIDSIVKMKGKGECE